MAAPPATVVSILQALHDSRLHDYFTVVGTHALFQRKESQLATAINDKGFEVDFLRRQPIQGDPHPFRFTEDDDDLWPIQAERASVLTDAPRFEQVVVSANGKMTMMRTIAPESFVEFKQWMAEHAQYRDPAKRRRDLRQAQIVQGLLSEGLLLPSEQR